MEISIDDVKIELLKRHNAGQAVGDDSLNFDALRIIQQLEKENQSLHDQITEMEAERIKIYQFAAKAKVAISSIQAT